MNLWIIYKEISREQAKIEIPLMKEDKNYQNLWTVEKEVLRGKFMI